jgi:hypothetical protein
VLLAAFIVQEIVSPPTQSAESYRAAIDNDSTSPYFVMITVTDRNAKTIKTRCVPGTFLLGAIHVENRLPYDVSGMSKARDIALAGHRHHFEFGDPAALRKVGFYGDGAHNERACEIIKRGHAALQVDVTGETREVPLAR